MNNPPCHNTGCNAPEGECSGACLATTTRRVRAGGPPPADMPVQFAGDEPEAADQLLIACGVILTLLAVFAGYGLYSIIAGWLQ